MRRKSARMGTDRRMCKSGAVGCAAFGLGFAFAQVGEMRLPSGKGLIRQAFFVSFEDAGVQKAIKPLVLKRIESPVEDEF